MSRLTNSYGLTNLGLLDAEFDRDLDDLTLTASELLSAPTSMLTIIDDQRDRQYFKSFHGLADVWAGPRETPLSQSLCKIVRDSNQPLLVGDGSRHDLVRYNPAISPLGVIAYLGVPVHDPQGKPLGALCVTDSTPRVWNDCDVARLERIASTVSHLIRFRSTIIENERARRSLKRVRTDAERLARVIENSGNEVYVYHGETLRFLNVNKGACRNLQYSLDELRGMTPYDINKELTPELGARIRKPLREGLVESQVFETVHTRKDGTSYPVEIRVECDRSDGEVIYFAFCTDLTEHKAMIARLEHNQREAEAATRAKSAFIANISHEIRTPLNGVLGMAEVLAMTPLQPEQQQMLATIATAGSQLLTLLNDILDLSKIEAGMFGLNLQPFVPAQAIEGCAALFEAAARARGLAFAVTIAPALHETWIGSDTRIRQIVNNLVGNALKFTETGGIAVTADILSNGQPSDGALLRISVQDTGPGIPDALKPAVFERFQQGSHTADKQIGGAGLGLTIARALCCQHEGDLQVQDTPGGGATFVALLRLQPALQAMQPQQAPASAALHDLHNLPRPLRILVAEDNATNRTILSAMLKSVPVYLMLVENGMAALDALKSGQIDAALLDIQMPGMGGDAVARALREHEEQEGLLPIPLVSWTASVSSEQMRAYELAGFDTSLPKPTTGADLARTIRWISERVGIKDRGAATEIGAAP